MNTPNCVKTIAVNIKLFYPILASLYYPLLHLLVVIIQIDKIIPEIRDETGRNFFIVGRIHHAIKITLVKSIIVRCRAILYAILRIGMLNGSMIGHKIKKNL